MLDLDLIVGRASARAMPDRPPRTASRAGGQGGWMMRLAGALRQVAARLGAAVGRAPEPRAVTAVTRIGDGPHARGGRP